MPARLGYSGGFCEALLGVSRVCQPEERSVAGTYDLRDRFFGQPMSVVIGPAKNLTHRAWVRRSRRWSLRPPESPADNAPARTRGMESATSVARPEERSVTGTYGLREGFFGQPMPVVMGPAKNLTHRA